MTEKIAGYILLAVGIIIILLSAISVHSVFTKQSLPIQLFNFPAISMDLGQSLNLAVASKPAEIISADMINQTSNIFAHLFLMGFLAGVGQKLASLGIQLLRPIVVKLKEEKP